MTRFVKHFMFWTIVIAVVALSAMTGMNAVRGQIGNAVVDGMLVILFVAAAYFVFCLIAREEK